MSVQRYGARRESKRKSISLPQWGDFTNVNLPPPPQKEDMGVDHQFAVHNEWNRHRQVQEWSDDIFLLYGIEPPNLPCHCNVCGVGFSISRALNCIKGGLVTSCYNKLCDRVAELSINSLTPTHVRNDPLINPSPSSRSGKTLLAK